jgi:hypothetical protein
MKVIKERSKFSRYINELLRLGGSFETLFFSIVSVFFFCHLAACLWYMLANLREFSDSEVWTQRLGYMDAANLEVMKTFSPRLNCDRNTSTHSIGCHKPS